MFSKKEETQEIAKNIVETEPAEDFNIFVQSVEEKQTEPEEQAVTSEPANEQEEQEQQVKQETQSKEKQAVEVEAPNIDINKYKEWEEISGLWEIAKQDPVGFVTNIIAETQKNIPSKEAMLEEVRKKYGEDFEYDPVEAYKNPNSLSAQYKNDIDKIEVIYRMAEVEAENERKKMMQETERVYREGQVNFKKTLDNLKKEYDIKDEELRKIIEDIGNPNMNASFPEKLKAYNDLLVKYITMAVKATKGLEKLNKTLEVEKRVDAGEKKKTPSTPTSGKPVSQTGGGISINDILLGG